MSTGERKSGSCSECSKNKISKSYREAIGTNKPYPEWFINELNNEEDKDKARTGELKSDDKVEFYCPVCKEIYIQRVASHIKLSTHERKKRCPKCGKEKQRISSIKTRKEKRIYPEWFINELNNECDKERAENSVLLSRDKVEFTCKKNHTYFQYVGSHFSIKKFSKRCGCPICASENFRSSTELEIEGFIKSLGFSLEHKRFTLDQSHSFEVDIYIPDRKTGIEFNGSYYHKTLPDKEPYKEKLYHQNKYDACKKLGIKLISIFDVDWIYREEKVKQYLRDLLLPKENKVYARKTEIRHVNYKEANEMYDKYHLLGKTSVQSISFGLFYNEELVSCMSFQKGRYKENNDPVWCLTRFVTKSGLVIVGGASKLLTQFEKEFNPSLLISFSDNDYFSGGVYEKLGFSCYGYTNYPRYYWFFKNKEIKREQCQLKRLSKKYPDLYNESLEIKGNKEDYIMLKLGAYKVYRSGHTKWVKKYSKEK